MAWVRIHDGAIRHPKIVGLLDWNNPFCVWVWCLSYAQEHLTDGLVIRAAFPGKKAIKTAQKLVDSGLLSETKEGYEIHDYLQWNDSRNVVLEKRLQARERVKKHRSNAVQRDDVTRNVQRTSSSGVVLHSSRSSEAEKEHTRSFDQFWSAYPRKVAKTDALKAWAALRPSDELVSTILAAIAAHATSEAWQRDGGKFVPYPATWLRGRRWEDVVHQPASIIATDAGVDLLRAKTLEILEQRRALRSAVERERAGGQHGG